jgi:hypothetical protein
MRVITLLLTASLLAGLSGFSLAAELSCSAQSGNTTVPLLELYTSEGCSSCPPADEWLSSFRQSGLVPYRVVPLALHVDYWNDLGWENSYSQKTFTDRQYRLADLNRMRTVFTPQFVLNGRNLSRWYSQADIEIKRINATAPQARISLVLSHHARNIGITADAETNNPAAQTDLYLAIYENNLSHDIGAGENRDLTLRHDYVARQLIGPMPLKDTGKIHFVRDISLDKSWKESDMGVVAFVQNRNDGAVLQALSLPLCR